MARSTSQNGYTLIFQSNIASTNCIVSVDTMTVFLCLLSSTSLTELYQNSIKYSTMRTINYYIVQLTFTVYVCVNGCRFDKLSLSQHTIQSRFESAFVPIKPILSQCIYQYIHAQTTKMHFNYRFSICTRKCVLYSNKVRHFDK